MQVFAFPKGQYHFT